MNNYKILINSAENILNPKQLLVVSNAEIYDTIMGDILYYMLDSIKDQEGNNKSLQTLLNFYQDIYNLYNKNYLLSDKIQDIELDKIFKKNNVSNDIFIEEMELNVNLKDFFANNLLGRNKDIINRIKACGPLDNEKINLVKKITGAYFIRVMMEKIDEITPNLSLKMLDRYNQKTITNKDKERSMSF